MLAASDMMAEGLRRYSMAQDPPHLCLEGRLHEISVLQFHRAAEAIAEGRRMVRENAGRIAALARV